MVIHYHKWSGWPGAFCLICGSEDPMEIALADNWYDPVEDKWDSEEHRLEVEEYLECPGYVCPNCKNEIDPETCYCGEDRNGSHDNHYFKPLGCKC